MELKIGNSGTIRGLTLADKASTASSASRGSNGSHKLNHPAGPVRNNSANGKTNTVCAIPNCGVINSDTITCEHTLARYQSEYTWG